MLSPFLFLRTLAVIVWFLKRCLLTAWLKWATCFSNGKSACTEILVKRILLKFAPGSSLYRPSQSWSPFLPSVSLLMVGIGSGVGNSVGIGSGEDFSFIWASCGGGVWRFLESCFFPEVAITRVTIAAISTSPVQITTFSKAFKLNPIVLQHQVPKRLCPADEGVTQSRLKIRGGCKSFRATPATRS